MAFKLVRPHIYKTQGRKKDGFSSIAAELTSLCQDINTATNTPYTPSFSFLYMEIRTSLEAGTL